MTGDDDEPNFLCTADYAAEEVNEGEQSARQVRLYTDPERVGPRPLRAGTYVLDQQVGWGPDRDSAGGDPDRQVVVRITYTVTADE